MSKQSREIYITGNSVIDTILGRIAERLDYVEGLRADLSEGYYYLQDGELITTNNDPLLVEDVIGTDDKITVTDNGDGTITITIPDTYLPASVLGTTNQITVTDEGDGTITISLPSPVTTPGNLNVTGIMDADSITVNSYERHIQIAAAPSGTVAEQAVGATAGTAVGLQFASTPAKHAGCQWEVPSDWVGGEDIYIEIDWMANSGAMSGTDAVKFDIEYRSIAAGELVTQGTSVTVTDTNSDDNAQYKTIHTRFTLDFDNANQPITKEDHMYFLVKRDVDVANDFAGTVLVTAFEIIYNSNTIPTSN